MARANDNENQAKTGTIEPVTTEPLNLNSCRSLDYARGNKFIIYLIDLCKPVKTYIYARKKHPFASYPAEKHPNASNLWLQKYNKNQCTFFINTARATTLALATIVQTQVLMQKFPFLVRYTIHWWHAIIN